MIQLDVFKIVLRAVAGGNLTTYNVAGSTASGAITALFTDLSETEGENYDVETCSVVLRGVRTPDESA